ncbi:SDR family NAD(P)-dependent oxidoreductase [Amycolatopsis rhabdoformis]|uniref:SDR family NAD(P)-dependent oxidoreductase n=1 Tax=Amycolatopsis rhabdoformis TaxID=1448059 RepID=A0ABZ1IHI0_9PSEU|nr:SDR family NAD(P)-dependent oxidoreductase [Amycolatopsis rhabdoformis]WSE33613.1 SDR family NAD(P)-dependent oxidoreductase [Amycolatopsis rhabdoformis]
MNGAGISLVRHLPHTGEREGTRILRVNREAAGRAGRAVGEVPTGNGGRAVVNIASIPGVVPAARPAAYAAAEAGPIGFGAGPDQLTVNTLATGIVRTPILSEDASRIGVPAEEIFAGQVRPVAVGRPPTAAGIGALTGFLPGPGARGFSGETAKVTGGRTTAPSDFSAASAAAVRAGAAR